MRFFLAFISVVIFRTYGISCSDVYITTQQQVDDFQTTYGCDSIFGNVTVTANVTNITGLSNIVYIEGNLLIQLTNISSDIGLPNLNRVGGNLYVSYNYSATSINGWTALQYVGGSIGIGNNTLITSLEMDNVVSVGDNTQESTIAISGNTALSNLNTFATG